MGGGPVRGSPAYEPPRAANERPTGSDRRENLGKEGPWSGLPTRSTRPPTSRTPASYRRRASSRARRIAPSRDVTFPEARNPSTAPRTSPAQGAVVASAVAAARATPYSGEGSSSSSP